MFVTRECAGVQNLHLSGQKNRNDASRELHFFALTKLVVDDQLITSKNEIPKIGNDMSKKLRI